MRFVALVICLALGGCVSMRPVATTVDSPSGVRVVFTGQDDDLFKLEVINFSQCVILVDRDRVTLNHASGAWRRERIPGGMSSLYTIIPGGHHAVHVKFKLDDLNKGQRVFISFDGAVVAQTGQPLPVSPLVFDVE